MSSVFDETGALPEWAQEDPGITAVVEDVTNLEPEAPTEAPVAPADSPPVPEEAAPEAAAEEAPPAGETPAEEAPAEQAPSPEQTWEKRYGDLFRKRQEEVGELRRIAAERDQLQSALSQVVPVLQKMAAQKREPSAEELEKAGIDPELYKQVAPVIASEVDARTRAIGAQMAQAQQQQQLRAEEAAVASNIASFMTEHQIERGSEQDNALGSWMQAYTAAAARVGLPGPDMTDRAWLDIALEAVESPAFGRKLLANPHWTDDDDLVALAREEAAMLEGIKRTPATTQPNGSSQPLPQVVRGGGGGNPTKGSPRTDDPLADAKALVAEERTSIF